MTPKLLIPEAALTQHVIVLGKTGSGKSSKLRVLVEHLLRQDRPVCIIDPKGDWWGLKSSADGKSSGFPIVIFGGEHADVPLNAHAGAHVAELVATGNRSCLIDLGGWMVGERTRFFLDFAPTLFKHARGARHLVIDEVHNFAPKGKILDLDAGNMLHWANRLASEGRGKGLTLIAASQRPQKVHNDFLTSCETLIACRVIHKADRDAIKDWIDGCADPATGREVMAELAGMKRTEAWVWSPEIEFGPARITFPMFATYDSFKPQAADARKLKGWAAVDLEEVKTKLAGVVAEAEANDPKKLKAMVVQLQKELRAAQQQSGPTPEQVAEIWSAAAAEASAAAIDALRTEARPHIEKLQPAVEALAHALLNGWVPPVAPARPSPRPRENIRPSSPNRVAVAAPAPRARPAPSPRSPKDAGDVAIGGTPRKMLNAMAMLDALGVTEPTQATVAGWVGISSKTGTWRNYMSELRGNALIVDLPGKRTMLTDAGRDVADAANTPPTLDKLHDIWRSKLGGTAAKMLTVIIEAYPDSVMKNEIGEAVGIDHTTGTFRNYLSEMRGPGIIEDVSRGGPVVATELLFPEGLR